MELSLASKMEMITWWFVRNHYEDEQKSMTVPVALKYLIRNFSKKIFNSKMLSNGQALDLIQLLEAKLAKKSIKRMNLLYRASDHEYLASKFHDLCDGKNDTIVLIQSDFGNIFGGYTNIPWSTDGEYHRDKDKSFLFLLYSNDKSQECPKIWNYTWRANDGYYGEVRHERSGGPIFGGGHDIMIYDKCNSGKPYNYCHGFSFIENNKGAVLCGGSKTQKEGRFIVTDYEVFQIVP